MLGSLVRVVTIGSRMSVGLSDGSRDPPSGTGRNGLRSALVLAQAGD